MGIYKDFAYYYDLFMDDIPYDEWADYIHLLLKNNGVNDGIVCELGCGTGEITGRLHKLGYDMIGIDNSEEMLMQAGDKMYDDSDYSEEGDFDGEYEELNNNIIYLLQDMRSFELYGTAAAFISVCDSINYITEYEELVNVFKNVNNYLDRNGVFIFDLKTEYFYKNILSNNHYRQEREEGVLIWDNTYDEERHENAYDITIDVYGDDDTYYEIKEHHVQKCYTIDEIIKAIEEAGMKLTAVYDAFTQNKPRDDSERIYFVAREGYQPGKTYL